MKTTSLLAICLLALLTLQAQQPFAFSCTFNHMAYPAKNLDASVGFYKKVFGLQEITNRTAKANIRWLSLGDEKELHLISETNPPVVVNKSLHLALSTNNMDALVKHLQALGIAFVDWAGTTNTISPRADGVMQLYLQDPDGYWIEVNNGYAAPTPEQQVKDAIWKLEEDYWVYVKNRDFKQYLTLWDDKFIGYPSTNIIGGKANITNWITEMYGKHPQLAFDYKLERKVENVFGDIVIVLYDATMLWKDAQGTVKEQSTAKLTHTWKRTDKGWLIIGGMGAVK
jgi:catechol 2,3-dioxygenase-like lactoylglutathione lyase family enzyme/ketosteroid isomerase-like protein